MSSKHQGIVVKYDQTRHFGFIRMKTGLDVFFHQRHYRAQKTPTVGEAVVFALANDKQGRLHATQVQELDFVIKQQQAAKQRQLHAQARRQQKVAYQAHQDSKITELNSVCAFALLYFLAVIAAVVYLSLPKLIIIWYALIGMVSYLTYYRDKQAALHDRWRIPERRLHTYDVLGGWIGASFAQRLLDHKASKSSFRTLFYLSIFMHIIGALVILWQLIQT